MATILKYLVANIPFNVTGANNMFGVHKDATHIN
jgi:hypothetical protein